ncbi:hypothetical protein EGW08_005685 [Elysia chlorotica]|uniref:Uncharacterized protein n=1 Tax=Elysia chlorotica TaxID=188477 RepID=A0A433TYA1_ELYCH|nr:hypothetical protein EGW08_005685 [Elysia chlorotica]
MAVIARLHIRKVVLLHLVIRAGIKEPGEQFNPSPCEFCHCLHSGNCRAPDGTVITEGETYTTASGAVCKCPDHGGLFWGAQSAICTIKLTPPPTVSRDDLAVS